MPELAPPRERILDAAQELFYGRGINVTGVDELSAAAGVSKRTLYKQFAGKDDVVAAYLERLEDRGAIAREAVLDREDLTPRERLLAIFDVRGEKARGCPFANAAVEYADVDHPVHRQAARHRRAFGARLKRVAAEAGVEDPAGVALQLQLLFDGLSTQLAVEGRPGKAAAAARRAAEVLLAA